MKLDTLNNTNIEISKTSIQQTINEINDALDNEQYNALKIALEQKFLEVYKDGKLWFEFPKENELNVREYLMREKIDRICDIKPKINDVTLIKKKIKTQEKNIDLNLI